MVDLLNSARRSEKGRLGWNSTLSSTDRYFVRSFRSCTIFQSSWPLHPPTITSFTLSQSSSAKICLNSNMALICRGWSFSGLNCPRERILTFSPSLSPTMCARCEVSQGGNTLATSPFPHSVLMCSSVQLLLTITQSALCPHLVYNQANIW